MDDGDTEVEADHSGFKKIKNKMLKKHERKIFQRRQLLYI